MVDKQLKDKLLENLVEFIDNRICELDKKIGVLDEQLRDLDAEYKPRIDLAEKRFNEFPTKTHANEFGRVWGEYKGSKEGLAIAIDYLKTEVRDYLVEIKVNLLKTQNSSEDYTSENTEENIDNCIDLADDFMPELENRYNKLPDTPIMER
ncbi:MAG: hypothetical protein HY363_04165 [Candidatus Aenigmarchaeota archaeon]|nr:hypothetical protein [Candidatus Aenigmarchaeota archaeon]